MTVPSSMAVRQVGFRCQRCNGNVLPSRIDPSSEYRSQSGVMWLCILCGEEAFTTTARPPTINEMIEVRQHGAKRKSRG